MAINSQEFMNLVWQHRNNGADTEEKLVSAILMIAAENIQFYTAQDGRIVLDKNDLVRIADELNG